MNKALHALVYVFLVLAAAALWFEMQLNGKRSLLTDRNRLQEKYLVQIARTIEKGSPEKGVAPDLAKDVSPVEARLVDSPDMENVLGDYNADLEQANLETFDWSNEKSREQLRAVYALDSEGKPMMEGDRPVMEGPGTEQELLSTLFEAAKTQRSRLDTTRAELVSLRGILKETVDEINKLKPEARQDKVTIQEKSDQISKLEEQKTSLENDITKIKAQLEECNSEITSLKDEVTSSKDELEEKKEELAKTQRLVEQLRALTKEIIGSPGTESAKGGIAVSSIPAGDKGKIVEANNEDMFAIVEFGSDTMKELKGNNQNAPLPQLELGVRRPGYNGQAGEFVGRIRIRQEVRGKNYVICDILGAWEQAKLQPNDIIFAD